MRKSIIVLKADVWKSPSKKSLSRSADSIFLNVLIMIFINDAPDDASKATLVKKAMEAIETETLKWMVSFQKKYMLSLYQK